LAVASPINIYIAMGGQDLGISSLKLTIFRGTRATPNCGFIIPAQCLTMNVIINIPSRT